MKPLSFIIITYNRPADLLELLKNIAQLDQVNKLVEEIIIINNASTEDYTETKEFIARNSFLPFRYWEVPENLGVARGRNYALAKGKAPFLILLDDDAVLQNKDCLIQLLSEFQSPKTERPIAIVSFKVLYYDTLQMQVNALPHKKFREYRNKNFFETYYYAGGAHAIRREVIEQLGYYPDDFFYGMEEYDLAYRVLNAGYGIVFSSKIVMLHKESPAGRPPQKTKLLMMWVNKCKVAWRYLPKKYYYSTSLLWSLLYLKSSRLDFRGFLKGWKKVLAIPQTEKRTPLAVETLAYLKKLKARLWY